MAVSLLATAALLLSPAASLARTHRSSCTGSPGHSHRSGHACTHGTHRSKPGRHTRHPAGTHRTRHAAAKGPARRSAGAPVPVGAPAICEDETIPVGTKGTFSCADGSQPSCEDGSSPLPAAGGKLLLCPAEPKEEAGAALSCEEGSGGLCVDLPEGSTLGTCGNGSAIPLGSGEACPDGSQPGCEAGTVPLRAPDGTTLLCLPVADTGEE